MTYENYSFVFWTPATPITADRLSQMSTNTDQVKAATDDNPKGIIKLKNVTTTSNTFNTFSTSHELIALQDDTGSNGPNNTISVAVNRYYKVSLSFPGITILGAGGEDCTFLLSIKSGTANAPANISTWKFTPPTYTFIDNATLPNNTNLIKIKTTNSFPTKIGAGTYTYVGDTGGTAISGQRIFATITREIGSSNNNASSFNVVSSVDNPMQLYVEDVGGTV
jgi:hypothetical protein